MPQKSRTFTQTYDSRTNVLHSPVKVTEFFDENTTPVTQTDFDCNAIWDTGATHTCISPDLVKKLGLIPSGLMKVHGVHGAQTKPTYLICIYLPNHTFFENITASEVDIGSYGVLIGMDIIGNGDLAISNYNNRTVLSFRSPPAGEIDLLSGAKGFSDKHTAKTAKVGPNEKCPCGSKKKYKKCCGRSA